MSDQSPTTKDAEKHVKARKLFKKGKRYYCSATVSTVDGAELFARTLHDIPQTAFRVWNAMLYFMKKYNRVDVRMWKLAEFCDITTSTVYRAIKYMEEKNLIVRMTEPKQDAKWMLSPDVIWNSSHEEHTTYRAIYHKRRFKNRENKAKIDDAQNAKIRKEMEELEEIIKDIPNFDELYAKIGNDEYDYFIDCGQLDDEETEPCELKSKAA